MGISSPTAGSEGDCNPRASNWGRMSTDGTWVPLCTPYVVGDSTGLNPDNARNNPADSALEGVGLLALDLGHKQVAELQ